MCLDIVSSLRKRWVLPTPSIGGYLANNGTSFTRSTESHVNPIAALREWGYKSFTWKDPSKSILHGEVVIGKLVCLTRLQFHLSKDDKSVY